MGKGSLSCELIARLGCGFISLADRDSKAGRRIASQIRAIPHQLQPSSSLANRLEFFRNTGCDSMRSHIPCLFVQYALEGRRSLGRGFDSAITRCPGRLPRTWAQFKADHALMADESSSDQVRNQSLRLLYSHISLAAPHGGQRKLPEVGGLFGNLTRSTPLR
jgi:hypothetical protein